jgi:hypothetical protein
MKIARPGYFPFLGFLLAIVVMVCAGCQQINREVYVEAAESGWQRWESDHKPVISDDAYNALDEDQRKLYMPQAVYNSREFERREGLRLLKGPADNERD